RTEGSNPSLSASYVTVAPPERGGYSPSTYDCTYFKGKLKIKVQIDP
ncbi:MAG: hypothetical protein ACD_28C00426G0001, partial [uncultured bacterium]